MDEMLRSIVWKRDRGICQECGIKLTKTVYPPNPKDVASKELSNLTEIPIIKWKWECWYCSKDTPIVSYYFENYFTSYSIGMIDKLDSLLLKEYSFVNRTYTKSMGKVIANTCINCNKPQGNSHVAHELSDLMAPWKKEEEKQSLIETTIPNYLIVDDLGLPDIEPPPYEEKILAGEIHHIDLNWQNDEQSNLILLCKPCHSKLGKKSTSFQSRKIARANAKSRKQKKEADKWRKNYYAKKSKL
jgi:hypothetical protein